MSRIQNCLAALKDRAALIPYIAAGDPDPATTLDVMHAMVEAGADIIELGVPFSDPMADGPTIQAACERALLGGMTLRRTLDLVARFRETDNSTPVVLMGYLNPVEAMGADAFAAAAKAAGVDGVLSVDLTVEEADTLAPALLAQDLDPIFLVAPTTEDDRIRAIGEHGRGYLYYVSLKGVTGSRQLDLDSVRTQVARIREFSSLPIAVGFGIRTPETAAAVAGLAEGVVVGSALVELMEQTRPTSAIATAVAQRVVELRRGIDQAAERNGSAA